MDSSASPTTANRKRFRNSLRYAWSGVSHAVRSQRHLRVHLAIAAAVLVAAFLVGVAPLELAVLLVTITLVLMAELFNTAAEAIVDLVSPEYHPLAKVAKDVAAGAVLVSAGGAVLVGLAILLPRIVRLVGQWAG